MSVLKIETPEVFVPLLEPSRYKGAHGGRGSGKSHFFAELLVEAAFLKPGIRAVCIREVQKSLKESAKRLVEDKIVALEVGFVRIARLLAVAVVSLVVEHEHVLLAHEVRHDALEHLPLGLEGVQLATAAPAQQSSAAR